MEERQAWQQALRDSEQALRASEQALRDVEERERLMETEELRKQLSDSQLADARTFSLGGAFQQAFGK